MATTSRINTTPTPTPVRIHPGVERRRRCLSGATPRSDGGRAPPGGERTAGGLRCCSCSGGAGASWTTPGVGLAPSLPAHQLDQAVRQLIGTRHPRPIHQDRDHPNLARQSSLDLQPNKIIGVVKATPPMRIGDRQPLVTDERHQHITGTDRSGDHLDEIITQLDRVDVLEDLPAAEAVCQPVVQPAGRVSGLLSPVAAEDPTRRGWRARTSHCPHLLKPTRPHQAS